MKKLTIRLSNGQTQMVCYALSLFFMKGLSLIMLPITTRFLSPVQIGELELLAVTASFIGILLSGCLHEALYRYCSNNSSSQRKHEVANQLFSMTLMISICLATIGLLLTTAIEWSASWVLSKDTVLILWLSLTIEGAIAVCLAWLRMQDKIKAFCQICIGTSVLQVTLVIGALLLDFDVIGVLLAGFIAHCAQFFALIYSSQLRFCLPNVRLVNTALSYSLPLMLSSIIAFGLNGAERWFMLQAESLYMVGQYAIAAKFALALCVLIQPFGMWWLPKRYAMLDKNKQKAAKITEIGVIYICIASVSVAVFGQYLLHFALTEQYAFAASLLVGAIFMVLGKEFTELLNLGLLYQKQTRTILWVNFSITLCTVTWCAITYQWGIWSIMISIGCAQLLRAALVYYLSQGCCFLPFRTIRLCLYPLITISTLISIHNSSPLMSLLLVVISSLLFLAIYQLPAKKTISLQQAKSGSIKQAQAHE
ncbi:lipopolysaccharide biosynthesis protein [Vibrio sp. B1Z05]|uniref:lipopolysaccharide biosynthesis protein n=1 Tax=Vibrio sp. B1Z05 TaxID=2654980 RepID=UPI00128ADE2A|nr:oligosaccharide flippase family protein [Vibrio sp. B1Z05]MPW36445.1 oligosaccharide flippase family protein [Vibrio sp. B1Z05]